MWSGSTQGIGLGMLKGLAKAGANVVMHGLLPAEEAEARCRGFRTEYKVQVGHSAADVTKPPEIRQALQGATCQSSAPHTLPVPAEHGPSQV